ncbi:DNA topoisomerase IV subunit B, partial [Candidatus Woesearchaeota archaeon]|nr:DNA topoisomerase IV subunit B [Candidatus Woesearchaeota archaeon]
MSEQYTADSIVVMKGLEAVRRRSAMYIGDLGIRGLHHLVYEVVDNSLDEHLAGYATKVEVSINKDGSVTVEDNGRGIPVEIHPEENKSALEVVMTVLHAGGKFDKKNYKVSGGLHGVGVSVTNALSKYLIVKVKRNGQEYQQEYAEGKPLTEVKIVGEANGTGTSVTFMPDNLIFQDTTFHYDILAKRLRELAFLNKGLEITFSDLRVEKKETFKFDGGISSFVKELNKNKTVLHDVVYLNKENSITVETALQYNDGYSENVYTYVNNINTIEGGTHLAGFYTALTRSINNYIKRNKINGETTLTGEDVREG